MTEKILKEFSRKMAGAKLVPGVKGAFEVTVNGALVFSKLELGRFPDIKEIRESIKAAL
ncbi:MAG: Rdx family protein [Chloroflexi bacterium]|nr:Rdx family protein [Chloroflexota bacterium]